MATAGQRDTFVTLEDRRAVGTVTFNPSSAWVAMRPAPPGAFDEGGSAVEVEMDYHPQVTTDTRLVLEGAAGPRHFWVKGVQNVLEQNRVLVCLCQEVKTP